MPRYEFLCHNCKKLFSRILSPVDYEEGEVLCPHCGSKEVEQCRLQRDYIEEERLKPTSKEPHHAFRQLQFRIHPD